MNIIPANENVKVLARTDEQLIAFSESVLEYTLNQLTESHTLADMVEGKAKASAIREYVKRMENSRDAKKTANNNISEAIIRQERRIGELLVQMERDGSRAKQCAQPSNTNASKNKGNTALPSNHATTISDIGISKMESSRAQSVASIPEPEFERHIAEKKERGETLTSGGVYREAKRLKKVEGPADRLRKELNRMGAAPKVIQAKDTAFQNNASEKEIITALTLWADDVDKSIRVGRISPEAVRFIANRLRALADHLEKEQAA